jgi:hypothetical protein
MWPCVVLMLTATDPMWDEPISRREQVSRVGVPKAYWLRDAYDEMQSAMKVWNRERREMLDEQVLESQRQEQRARDKAPLSKAALRRYKFVDVSKGGHSRGKGKVIETKKQREGLDAQIDQLEDEADEHRENCREDPAACAKTRRERIDLARGAALWEEAVEANYAKRKAAIEAEARRFQKQLDDARRREEQKQAEKMGGSIDSQGNFVDSDLKEVPKKQDGK